MATPLPSRRSAVPPFEVMDVLAQVATLRESGREVLSLCAGEPGQGAPSEVHAAALEAHRRRDSFGYTPALGTGDLRRAIAGHYRRWYDLDLDPEAVAITTGSSGGFLLAFLAAFDAGDRVALASPGYPAYRNILTSLGCEVVDLDCGPEVGYQPTVDLLESAAADGPLRGLVIASPANPTGTMLDRAALTAISGWCRDRGVRLVSDEIYHGVTYPAAGQADPRGVSAAELDPDAIVVSSFSKYWGMTGWRLGWLVMPEDLRAAISALAGNLALCPPAPAQLAAAAAFSERSYAECDAAVASFAANRDRVLAAAPQLGWGQAAPADGAFYYWASLGSAAERWADARAYAASLLQDTGVAITPGVDFDRRRGAQYMRLSYAANPEVLAQALARIADYART